ncbi:MULTISPECIES: hypothetical protein [unclassified Pseudoalteromonas]|uniref:hypothetical protein n=1 Tax=unclassified Pseudoalteromonas TaxID=194690 RepID=UPI0030151AEB
MEIINEILKWPVIVQGALGSALFWILIEGGQRVVLSTSRRLSGDKKTAMWFSLAASVYDNYELEVKCRQIAIYGGLHYFIKAMILIVISLLVSPLLHVVSMVGYLVAIYYLFRALSYIPHTSRFGTNDQKKELFDRLTNHALENANKKSQSDA